jgi:ElaB/YqjD/DUF883 family membrane-anchored ribosome-binding protein
MSASEKKAPATTETKADEPRDPEVIRAEIDGTREELGETVAAVAEKTDVKKQAEAKKDELKEQVSAKADALKGAAPESAQEGMQQAQRLASENPVPMALAGAFLAGMVLGRLLSR